MYESRSEELTVSQQNLDTITHMPTTTDMMMQDMQRRYDTKISTTQENLENVRSEAKILKAENSKLEQQVKNLELRI